MQCHHIATIGFRSRVWLDHGTLRGSFRETPTGIDMKHLSMFIRYASISITIDRCGYLLPGSEADAAARMIEFLTRA